MSQPVIIPPVHETSPPPFDDDVDENDLNLPVPTNEYLSSASSDVLNNSTDDWKSVEDNNDNEFMPCQDDKSIVNNQTESTENHKDPVEINTEHDITQIQDDQSTASNLANIMTMDDDQPIFNNENDTDAIQNDSPVDNNETVIATDGNDQFMDSNELKLTESQQDIPIVISKHISLTQDHLETEEQQNHDNGWANFAEFENKTDEVLEAFPTVTSSNIVENADDDDGWADFESNTTPITETQMQPSTNQSTSEINKKEEEEAKADDDDDDFGEFSEVQAAAVPPPQSSHSSTNSLNVEQIDSLIATCFPVESSTSSENDDSVIFTDLPSFTSYTNPIKKISCLESSLDLWKVLSTITNDPIGIKFQWRKSNTERLFHQALGVNERLRTKAVPLTPEILQPEKFKPLSSTNTTPDITNNLSAESLRPHFDWKQSGLQNPLADGDDSSHISTNINKDENNVFDANKTLDLDFYVPTTKSMNEDEQIASIQKNDTSIIQSPKQQSRSIPIKTIDLFPGSTTTLSDDAKRIIDSLPNLSFMSAKALMFPIRFNPNNNDESTSLY